MFSTPLVLDRGVEPDRFRVDNRTLLAICVVVMFAVELLRTAWLCDDAYITLRTVENVASGYGPRWNVGERVQAYTHPLWMLLLVVPYSVTHEAYFTPLFLSIGLSLATLWLFATRLAASWQTALIGGAVLMCSKAFVDYSTSGLENPLTHFLLALMLIVLSGASRWRDPMAWFVGGLAIVNRLDIGLLVLPALMARSWGLPGRRAASAAAIGLMPVALWEAFSITYYGFPFPNTAYAKLQAGVPQAALASQGLLYLLDSIAHDPVTLTATLAFTGVTLAAQPRRTWPWACGIALYILYVVWIGGDFMSGRFLSATLFAATATFAQVDWRLSGGRAFAVILLIGTVGLFATTRPPMTASLGSATSRESAWKEADQGNGIFDERAFYHRYTGLTGWSRQRPLPDNPEVAQGKRLRAAGVQESISYTAVGFLGYFAGPQVHIVDHLGLGDPLLARRPARPDWRIGHYFRDLPVGYVHTLRSGRNVIADPYVAMQYEQLTRITQGPLFSRRRWRAIWRMNTARVARPVT